MNREWNTLTHAQRDAVRAVVQRVRETGARADQIFEAGDIYAYPHPGGGIGLTDEL